ncbi:uncharacterized protein LOC127750083 [Frankliniella occidentalis]|uniref:Uncharacterized protein LOC127750083 n=1 Tax=Frankliniella occidentalis TaxID=133901 RepID=A0A9C6UEL1_FRAOC|nr:uncharacterized protein LOC127750083 [Frankliniella occidentalis]
MPKKSRRRRDTKKKQGRRPPVNAKQAKESSDVPNENSIEEQDPGSEHFPGNNGCETESVDLSPRVCLPFSPDLTNHSEVTASGTTCEMSPFNSFCPSAEEYDKTANISEALEVHDQNVVDEVSPFHKTEVFSMCGKSQLNLAPTDIQKHTERTNTSELSPSHLLCTQEQEVDYQNGVPDILQSQPLSSPSTCDVKKHTETAYNPDMSPLYFPYPNDDELAAGYASDTDILLKAKQKVDAFLPRRWISVVDRDHLHVMYLSNQQRQKAIQRSLEFDKDGEVRLFVHCKPFDVTPYLPKSNSTVPLPINWFNLNECVDRIVCIVNNLRSMEVCSGYDDEVYQDVWHSCEYGEIDKNPYEECRYVETFRSLSCKLLVKSNKWRCPECTKMLKPLKRRAHAAAQESRHKNTPNIALTEDQKLKKLKDQRKEIDNLKAKLSRVRVRMQEVIKKESLQLDYQLADSLTNLLNESDLSPAQSVFLQQQVKASQVKSASGMRWHPTMIRLALSLNITSPAAYEMLRNTGMVKLPSSRTLFDYSHARPAEEGIDKAVLEKLAETVEEMSEKINAKTQKKEVHKKYHVLMGDEMYISQNLVFQKST